LDGAGSAASRRGSDAYPTDLGFLGPWLFRCEGHPIIGLETLGFPWILSSESTLINGLRWLFAVGIFASLSVALRGAGTGARGRGHAEGQDCSWDKLYLFSDFLQ
jgi:hypothetical protein